MMSNKIRNNVTDDGMRRQKLHKDKDNKGNAKNIPQYQNLNGEPIR
ncbi:clostri-philic family protein [Clostridium manihotivorum]